MLSRSAFTPLICVVIALSTMLADRNAVAAERPNVLLIAIDDLNDWIGCLQGHPQARSPHIDRLAKRGTLFTNAHCQAPICNPSRTSIMYGMRPSTTGIYMNAPRPWTVRAMDSYTTLPRYFEQQGYHTYTTGKIYHGSGLPQDDFQHVGPRPGQRQKQDARLVPPTPEGASGLWDFGPQAYDESQFQDHVDATWALEAMDRHADEEEAPFFMAIGFYRPHVPFYSPTRVFNEIPLSDIDLPPVKADDRNDLPAIVDKVAVAPAAPPHSWFVESGRWREAVQSYLACVRWTDEQIGRLLDGLDASPHADNTIVVLYSDHGFFLGEKQRWAKQSLWERATRVPFIIAGPGATAGAECDQPVELLSIYPTLLDLCGLPAIEQTEGRSVLPLLKDTAAPWEGVALTTHGKNNHAVRDKNHRYIRYSDGSEELYDLRRDPNEWYNLADQPGVERVKKRLARHIPDENAEPARAAKPAGRKKGKGTR